MNPPQNLSEEDKHLLLRLARQSIELAVNHRPLPEIRLDDVSILLRENGASFVTLSIGGKLRGCIGALEPYQPLVQDVCEHAAAAALEDYRFPQVTLKEVPLLQIEISRLTPPQPLVYTSPDELLLKLRPHIDGVVLRDGMHRSTFLPQVWEKIPDPAMFLSQLCQKMGAPANHWRRSPLSVFTYQVEEFCEQECPGIG
jgi:AmmeMemoRadiSam system protein A